MSFLISEQSGQSGRLSRRARLTRIAEAVTTPLLPADYLDLFAPLRSGAELRGRIVSVHHETPDAATIEIKPGADWAGHVPGQYVRVGVAVDGVRQWRAYSLTHGPRADGLITITVKAVPDGIVSQALVHRCPVGSIVHLEQAAGEFVLPQAEKLLFVTAGSGITPVMGMLRNLYPGVRNSQLDSAQVPTRRSARANSTAHRAQLDIVVVHLAPSQPDSIFHADLRALGEAGAITLISRYDDEHGLFDVAQLADLVPDLAERTTLACGAAGLLDALETHHSAQGLTLQTEQFRPTLIEPGDGGTLTVAGQNLEADGATPLLDVAEAAGVLMPSGCRMGVCFGCVVPLKQGAVRDLRNGALTTAVEGDGVQIQTCINAAAGPCELETPETSPGFAAPR